MLDPAIHFMPAFRPEQTVMTARCGTSRNGQRKTRPGQLAGDARDNRKVIIG